MDFIMVRIKCRGGAERGGGGCIDTDPEVWIRCMAGERGGGQACIGPEVLDGVHRDGPSLTGSCHGCVWAFIKHNHIMCSSLIKYTCPLKWQDDGCRQHWEGMLTRVELLEQGDPGAREQVGLKGGGGEQGGLIRGWGLLCYPTCTSVRALPRRTQPTARPSVLAGGAVGAPLPSALHCGPGIRHRPPCLHRRRGCGSHVLLRHHKGPSGVWLLTGGSGGGGGWGTGWHTGVGGRAGGGGRVWGLKVCVMHLPLFT